MDPSSTQDAIYESEDKTPIHTEQNGFFDKIHKAGTVKDGAISKAQKVRHF